MSCGRGTFDSLPPAAASSRGVADLANLSNGNGDSVIIQAAPHPG
jgi:hypothetical protein